MSVIVYCEIRKDDYNRICYTGRVIMLHKSYNIGYKVRVTNLKIHLFFTDILSKGIFGITFASFLPKLFILKLLEL